MKKSHLQELRKTTANELSQIKPSVKRMMRQHKQEAFMKGRDKISSILSRVGVTI